jgi:hypothetical protein
MTRPPLRVTSWLLFAINLQVRNQIPMIAAVVRQNCIRSGSRIDWVTVDLPSPTTKKYLVNFVENFLAMQKPIRYNHNIANFVAPRPSSPKEFIFCAKRQQLNSSTAQQLNSYRWLDRDFFCTTRPRF